MAGLEIGQTRTFSFERMALHEPAKKTVTRDLKIVHTPAGRPWTVDVTYASDALDAKVVALHYLLDPPSGLYEGILERYGKGTPVASEPGVSSWDVPSLQACACATGWGCRTSSAAWRSSGWSR